MGMCEQAVSAEPMSGREADRIFWLDVARIYRERVRDLAVAMAGWSLEVEEVRGGQP